MLSLFTDCNTSLQPTRRLGVGCLLDPASNAEPSFVVIGDSHADALYPAFAKFSLESGRQGRLLQHIRCSPLLEATEVPLGMPACRLMQEQALALVTKHQVTKVIVVSRFAFPYMPDELFAPRLEKTIAAFAERGATVYIVLQAPEQPNFSRRDYLRAVLGHRFFAFDAGPEIRRLSVTRAEHEQKQAFVNRVFAGYRDDPRVRLIDFTSTLCDEVTCAAGTPSGPYYMDDHHLNATAALLVSDTIITQLTAP